MNNGDVCAIGEKFMMIESCKFNSVLSFICLAIGREDRIPVVVVACGSFSPITYLHLRLFGMPEFFVSPNSQRWLETP